MLRNNTRSVELQPTGMTVEQAMQVMQQLGINQSDLPVVAQAVQALIAAGALSDEGGAPPAPSRPSNGLLFR